MSTAFINRSVPPVGWAMTAFTSAAVMSVATTGGFGRLRGRARRRPETEAPRGNHAARQHEPSLESHDAFLVVGAEADMCPERAG